MPTDKFLAFPLAKLSEHIANLILPVLTKEGIWCQKLVQSGSYRGVKVCITAQNASRVAYIIKQARAYIESHKSLKDKQLQKVTDQSVLSDKQQLSTLFES